MDPLEQSAVDRAVIHKDLEILGAKLTDLTGEVKGVFSFVREGLTARLVIVEAWMVSEKEKKVEAKQARQWTLDKIVGVVLQLVTAFLLLRLGMKP